MHDVTGRSHVAHVAHGDVELLVHAAGDHRPLGALHLQEKVGELRDQLGIGDGAQVHEHHPVEKAPAGDAARQHVERRVRQVGPLDAAQGVVVGVAVQEREDVWLWLLALLMPMTLAMMRETSEGV